MCIFSPILPVVHVVNAEVVFKDVGSVAQLGCLEAFLQNQRI